jgi:FkbM family methyltransferase
MICAEPDPIVLNCLKRNVQDLRNVIIFNGVISDRNGETDFYIASKGADSSIIEPDEYETVIRLESKTLDRLLEDLGIDHVDFMKVEAEGAEPEVLKGARKALRMTKKIAIDCGPERRGSSTRNEVYACLKENMFDIFERDYMIYGIKRPS